MSDKHSMEPEEYSSEKAVVVENTTGVVVEDHKMTWRTILCLCATLLAYFATIFGLVGTGIYSYSIGTALGDTSSIIWLSNVGQILTAVLAPPVALASDIHGRKWFVAIGLTGGVIGGIISATSNSITICIAGATFTGLGLVVQPLLLAIAAEIVPRRQRANVQALVNVTAGIGGLLGIFLCGLYIKGGGPGWRYIYVLVACFYAISLIGFVLLYRPAENRPEECSTISNSTTTLGEIDFIGSFLLLAGLLPLLMGLSWANNPYPVTSLYVIVPIAIGCVSFILFGLYEWKGRTDGLVHHELFSQSRNFAICLVLIFVEGLIFFAFTIWLPQETTLVYEHDSFTVGVRYAAYFGSTVFMSGIAGWLATKFKNGSYLTAFGFALYLAGSIGMATAGVDSSSATIGYSVLAGLGFAFPLLLLLTIVQLSVPPKLLGLASALVLVSRDVGAAIGSAGYSAAYHAQLTVRLPAYVAAAVVPLGFSPKNLPTIIGAAATGNIALAKSIPGITLQMIGAAFAASTKAFSDSFRYLWFIEIPFVVVAIIGCFTLASVKESFYSDEVDATAELNVHQMKNISA